MIGVWIVVIAAGSYKGMPNQAGIDFEPSDRDAAES